MKLKKLPAVSGQQPWLKKALLAEIWEKINQVQSRWSRKPKYRYRPQLRRYPGVGQHHSSLVYSRFCIASILFAIVYLWVYHVSPDTGPRQEEELATENWP
jgi:hypothetical protein